MVTKADIKLIKSLEYKKFRRLHLLFVIEGERLIYEAVFHKASIKQLFITDEFISKPQHHTLMDLIVQNSIISSVITEKEMKSISSTVSPSGILAICEITKPIVFDTVGHNNWLYLDAIQDPGNLGTLLRSANWFGIKNVALSENCIDVYNPKVLRGGMGGNFNLNIYEQTPLLSFQNSPHTIIGAFQTGENINNIDRNQIDPWLLIIGNEAHGINTHNVAQIDLKVTIPLIGAGDSLNAAVAGSILLYQLTNPL